MSTTDEENVLEKLIEGLVNEVLRGFNLAKFKAVPGIEAKANYAESMLPLMGVGSSRIVFALSGGKVLKVARNEKGLAQNHAEVELYTDPNTKPVIARIFDADTTGNEWLIAEIVQPFQPNRASWEQALGFDFLTLSSLINDWEKAEMPEERAYLQQILADWQKKLQELITKGQEQSQMYKITQRRLKNYIRIAKSPIVTGIMSLIRQGLVSADLTTIDGQNTSDNVIGHWGKTIDGRVVLLDYGYNNDVWAKHYKKKDKPVVGADAKTPESAEAAEDAVPFYSASSNTGKRFGV